MTVRNLIADAISTVPGLAGHPWQPVTITPGQGWPEWQQTDYTTRMGICQSNQSDWDVIIALPATAAPAATDSIRDEVARALAAAGVLVTYCRPDEVTMGDTSAPALRYSCTTRP